MKEAWVLDPGYTHLNHGSFGACPRDVLATQQQWRERLERDAMQFYVYEYETLLDGAIHRLADFLGSDPNNLVFVPNATFGVNSVLQSFDFKPGDEILVNNHEYAACVFAAEAVAKARGAKVVRAHIPLPICDPAQVVDALQEKISPRTRLVLISHITSPSGAVFPIEAIVRLCEARGIRTLVDGAHAAGMVDVQLEQLGASYYTGNCHKWLCSPKGSAYLWVRKELQAGVRSLVISHGAGSKRSDRSRFYLDFSWPGTMDITGYLSVPAAIDCMTALISANAVEPLAAWASIRENNRAFTLAARSMINTRLGGAPMVPDAMIGSLGLVHLPEEKFGAPRGRPRLDPMQLQLAKEFKIHVPVFSFEGQRFLRISGQLYNEEADILRLGEALEALAKG